MNGDYRVAAPLNPFPECLPARCPRTERELRKALVQKIFRGNCADPPVVRTYGAVRIFHERFCGNGDPDTVFPELREILLHIGDDGIALPVAGAFFQEIRGGDFQVPLMRTGVIHDSAVQTRQIEIQQEQDLFIWLVHAVM